MEKNLILSLLRGISVEFGPEIEFQSIFDTFRPNQRKNVDLNQNEGLSIY